ncbi:Hypp6029 [Branchiostoma lanceolatum]|uniref:Hypp6029 protein n=1 Tax=Branchiostoma lanceolatum TaxID=7740 RepID=A0A8J9VTB5_BRALA|nr:Hypp6029 [Branchiostoma lanceolatum]
MKRSHSFHFGFFSALELERRSAPARHQNKVEEVLLKRKVEQLNRERRLTLNDIRRVTDKLKSKQRELPPPLSLYEIYHNDEDDDVFSEDSGYNSQVATAAARSTAYVNILFDNSGENIPIISSSDRGCSSGNITDISRPGGGLPPIASPDPLARRSPESSRREERPDDNQQGGLKEERSLTTGEEAAKRAETGNTGTNVANIHAKQTVDVKSDQLTVDFAHKTQQSARQVHRPKVSDADLKSNPPDPKENREEVSKADTKTPPYSFSPIERLRLSRHTPWRKPRQSTSQISGNFKNSDKPGIYSSAYVTQPPIWKVSLQELSPEFRKIAFGRRTKRKDAFAKNFTRSTQTEKQFHARKRQGFMYASAQAQHQNVQPSSYRVLANIQVLKTSALDRKWPEEKVFVKEVLKERKSWNLEKQLRSRVEDFLKKDHYVSTDSLKKDEVEENLEKLQKILSTK